MEIAIALLAGFIIDLIIGDPHFLPHPVRLVGTLISSGEKQLRKVFDKTPNAQYLGGIILTFSVAAVSFLIPYMLLEILGSIHITLKLAVHALFCYQLLATKSLKVESMRVYDCLAADDMQGARKFLSYIVGRDTENLDSPAIARAAVETVAENASDGVIAPMIFIAIGGAPLGFLYKAVNTMDSMIGYKNEKYLYFGRFAAKTDDLLNFIPAEISAYCMIAAASLLKLDTANAIKIYKRDKYNHASPNSAKTESVCAGALGVQLGGDNYYFGKLVKKPAIGDPFRPINMDDIPLANKLMTASAVVSLAVLLALRILGGLIV